jgi:hypothetical protein
MDRADKRRSGAAEQDEEEAMNCDVWGTLSLGVGG